MICALDRDVERRDRLVADDEATARAQARARCRRAGAGRRRAGAGSARPCREQPDLVQQGGARAALRLAALAPAVDCSGSAMIWPIVMRGLSDDRGPGRSPGSRGGCACISRRAACARSPVEKDLAGRRLLEPQDRCGRRWSCRSRTRRPGPASRPCAMAKQTSSTARTVTASAPEAGPAWTPKNACEAAHLQQRRPRARSCAAGTAPAAGGPAQGPRRDVLVRGWQATGRRLLGHRTQRRRGSRRRRCR